MAADAQRHIYRQQEDCYQRTGFVTRCGATFVSSGGSGSSPAAGASIGESFRCKPKAFLRERDAARAVSRQRKPRCLQSQVRGRGRVLVLRLRCPAPAPAKLVPGGF